MSNANESKWKEAYINEEVIDKGYNPEDWSNFLMRTTGLQIDSIPFLILKSIVEDFKNESFKATNTQVQKDVGIPSDKKTIESKLPVKVTDEPKPVDNFPKTLFEYLYPPKTYTFKCREQTKNELYFLNKENEPIKIVITDPQIEKSKGVIKSTLYTFLISCVSIHSENRRSLTDIEWLRERLIDTYPGVLIPPLFKRNLISEKISEIPLEYYTRQCQYFFDALTRKKILRTSNHWYNFLTMSDDEFEEYKLSEKNVFFGLKHSDFDLLTTMKGEMNFKVLKEMVIKSNSKVKVLANTISWYDKLTTCFESIEISISTLTKNVKEVSEIFKKWQDENKRTQQSKRMFTFLGDIGTNFLEWSKRWNKENNFFKLGLKEFFEYMNLEFKEVEVIWNRFEKSRYNYEYYGDKLKIRKEGLYSGNNFSKWDLPKDFKEFDRLKKDKSFAFEVMWQNESEPVEKMKLETYYFIYMIHNQYERLIKYQKERLEKMHKEFFIGQKEEFLHDTWHFNRLFDIILLD